MIPATGWLREMAGLALATTATLLLIASAELWRRWGTPAVESTRKLVHFGTGAVCLAFPVLFSSHLAVLAMAASFVGLMWGTRRLGVLPSIHAVDRSTEGGIYYPIAVWITFAIAQASQRMEFYAAAILVLAIGDAVAALVGKRYGEHRFQVEEGRRSFEGSVVLFVAAFVILYATLNLASDFGRVEAILASLYVALLVTLVEGISLSGTDNLWIPVATIAVLLNVVSKSAVFLSLQLLYLVAIVVFTTVVLARQRKLGFAPRVGLGLLVYSCQAFHGISWSLPALIAVVLASTGRSTSLKLSVATRVRPVFLCVVPMLGWILAARYLGLSDASAYPAFATTVGGCQAYLWSRSRPARPARSAGRALLLGTVLVAAHGLFDPSPRLFAEIAVVSIAIFGCSAFANRFRKRFGDSPYSLLSFTAASCLASLAAWFVHGWIS